MRQVLMHSGAKPVVWILCVTPLCILVMQTINGGLGAHPAERLIRETGEWALRGLCLTLSITPLRQITGQAAWMRFRRLLGLWTFAYACMHLCAYAGLDQGFDGGAMVRDGAQRPFILVGFLAWLALLLLAVTSFNRLIKALGAARWRAVHRLVYGVAVLGVLHLFWIRASKHRWDAVVVYATVVAVLLAWRGLRAWRARRA